MTIPANPNEPLAQEITMQDMMDFLNEKEIVHTCASCQQNNWALYADAKLEFGLVGMEKGRGFSIPPPILPVIMAICNNCGYVKSYAKITVGNWKLHRNKKP